MGIAFQKLNGAGTVPGAQLEQLEQINQMIGDSGFKPEIWKLARMFAPDVTLTPVQFVVDLSRDVESDFADWSDGNLYYGKWSYAFNFNYPMSDHSNYIKYVILEFFKDGDIQQRYRDGAMGDSNYPMQSQRGEFIGFADFIRIRRSSRLTEGWNCVIEFQGFVLGEGGGVPESPYVSSKLSYPSGSGTSNYFKSFLVDVDGVGDVSLGVSGKVFEYYSSLKISPPLDANYVDSYLSTLGKFPTEPFLDENRELVIDEDSVYFDEDLLLDFRYFFSGHEVIVEDVLDDLIAVGLIGSKGEYRFLPDGSAPIAMPNSVCMGPYHSDGKFWYFVDLSSDVAVYLGGQHTHTNYVLESHVVDNGDGTYRRYMGTEPNQWATFKLFYE
ncbi:hypothetical protein [Parapedobacter sp. 2B3]|uniref:hypothetical protein n=1 Tax=Parapedobacter sp. 2B3 TaxID=3342381 RepID=UPI0035B61DDF